MPQVEFEPTIPAFERAKTVHALDGAATVIGHLFPLRPKYSAQHQVLNHPQSMFFPLFEKPSFIS
jgi:hypothetical protein